ncbi:dihydrofolate reductase, partial [Streptomyces virginiae]
MTASPRDVWLPFPAEEVAGLPDSFRYRQWDGEDAFPADPADCVFYVAPYMKSPEVTVRPLAAFAPVRGGQNQNAGHEDVLGRLGVQRPGVRRLNAARG